MNAPNTQERYFWELMTGLWGLDSGVNSYFRVMWIKKKKFSVKTRNYYSSVLLLEFNLDFTLKAAQEVRRLSVQIFPQSYVALLRLTHYMFFF